MSKVQISYNEFYNKITAITSTVGINFNELTQRTEIHLRYKM